MTIENEANRIPDAAENPTPFNKKSRREAGFVFKR
jgi:hypothetical protein